MKQVFAPWTVDQVASLNAYQQDGRFHEFTGMDGELLIAAEDGWRKVADGSVIHTWAWEFMADWSWSKVPHGLI